MKLTLLIFTLAVSMATAFVETEDEKELNSIIELLLQAKQQQAGVSNTNTSCSCLTGFDIFAQTSGISYAQSTGPHDIQVSLASPENVATEKFTITDIPNKVNQAVLYTFALKECFTIFDVTNITLIAVSTDGWNIETIVTTFVDNGGRTYSGSIDRKVDRWVDHGDKPEYESFVLHLSNHG